MSIRMMAQMRRSIGTLLIGTLTLSGCTTWQAHTTPAQALGGRLYDVVIVHRQEGPGTWVWEPRITGDSLQGVERVAVGPAARAQGYVSNPVSIPLSAIQKVETPSTTMLPVLVVVVLGIVVTAISFSQSDFLAVAP